MQLLSPSVDPIISISPGSIEAEATIAASSVIFTNKTFNYSNTSSIINYRTDIESIYVIKKRNSKVKPDLTCSSTNTISYSIAQYDSSAIPAWISIDSSTGELTISAPEVSADSEYDFYINSQVSGFTNTVQKLIKLIVKNCAISHWDLYSDGSAWAWSTWSTGFTICTKNWDNQTTSSLNYWINSNSVSELASSATTVSQWVIGGAIAVTTLSSLTNASSIAGIWSLINQAQLFFLILLSRVFIPNDVKAVITGPNFAFNPYGLIPFEKVEHYSSIVNNFNFGLSNKILEPLKINSDSTIYNIMPFIDFTIFIALCHLALWITLKLFSKWNTGEDANRFTKFIKWLIERVVRLLTFGYYIRSMLEINQFFLISTINEIYEWNTSAKLRIVSLIFAILIISLCILMILFAAYLALSSYRIIEGQHNKLGEFLSGVKSQNKFKFYVAMLLTRRILFVLILIWAVSVSWRYVVISLVVLQAIYLSYIVLLRPFTNLKWNSIEIINEVYFITSFSILIYFDEESKWNQTVISIYVWLISSNSMITFLIIFSKIYL